MAFLLTVKVPRSVYLLLCRILFRTICLRENILRDDINIFRIVLLYCDPVSFLSGDVLLRIPDRKYIRTLFQALRIYKG